MPTDPASDATAVASPQATLPHAPLDRRLRPLLAATRRLGDRHRSLQELRALTATAARLGSSLLVARPPRVHIEDLTMPVRGGRIRLRCYRPPHLPEGAPLHLYLHGGGFCIGAADQREAHCAEIAVGAGCLVVSVDYRLAPENPFPTAPDDCDAALAAFADPDGELADRFGHDPTAISMSGESAGANLALGVALRARARPGGSPIIHLWLEVPVVDLTMAASERTVAEHADRYDLPRQLIDDFHDSYLQGADARDPRASPLFADDLTGLPPTIVQTAGYDAMGGDGLALVARLRAAGNDVDHRHLPSSTHTAALFTRLLPEARRYERTCIDRLADVHDARDRPSQGRATTRRMPAS